MLKTVLSYVKKFILRILLTLISTAGLAVLTTIQLVNGIWWAFTGETDGQEWTFKIGDFLDPLMDWVENTRNKLNSEI